MRPPEPAEGLTLLTYVIMGLSPESAESSESAESGVIMGLSPV
jgi:hypothetical protein